MATTYSDFIQDFYSTNSKIYMTDIFNINVNTSSLTGSELSEEQFSNDLMVKLQEILSHEFYDQGEKQNIRKDTVGLKFACPFCHDSHNDMHKKRGHIILSGKWAGRYKCFNCGKSMTIQQFFKSFDKDLSLQDINYINKNVAIETSYANSSTRASEISAQIINADEAYEYAISREFIRASLGLQEINRVETPMAYSYLVNRCQYEHHERFLWSEKYKQILILNIIRDRVLGIQIRNIAAKSGPKYLTLTIDKMRATMLNDKSDIPESVYKLSCVFNIFNVDFSNPTSKPVLVTEGPFDAFLLPNCIAVAGAAKNFNMAYPFWYLYDNDSTGKEHAITALQQGYKVFMWKKFMEAYNLPMKNPYGPPGDNYKWDVTDVRKYLRDNKSNKKIYWSPYFTNSTLDGFYI